MSHDYSEDALVDQIYKEFAAGGVITEPQAQTTSGEHLKRLLTENHRYIFTLIQKFHTERGKKDATLSERSDIIIVITDEAHRSQYEIAPHRKRMVKEDMDTKFKDPSDPFRVVFVCAMWMTGFDVPNCSTIYLDKPMRNHTLMQTIRGEFQSKRKRITAECLRAAIHSKLLKLVRLNRSRVDYLAKFQEMIDEYNAGSISVEQLFERLLSFAQGLSDEEKRHISAGLTEEELAIFDLLTRPKIRLTTKQEKQVKKVARELLQTLKNERLVLDWRKKQQARAAVRLCIQDYFEELPPVFTPALYQQKCELAYQHIYDSYFGPGRNIYAQA